MRQLFKTVHTERYKCVRVDCCNTEKLVWPRRRLEVWLREIDFTACKTKGRFEQPKCVNCLKPYTLKGINVYVIVVTLKS